jgi:hypothetical protein
MVKTTLILGGREQQICASPVRNRGLVSALAIPKILKDVKAKLPLREETLSPNVIFMFRRTQTGSTKMGSTKTHELGEGRCNENGKIKT